MKTLRYLANHVALITGSTGGIGEGVARCLAQRGANIVLNGFGDEKYIQNLLTTFKKDYGVDATYIGGDLSKPEDVKALYTGAVNKFPGGVDILVNNAGFQHVSPLESFPLDTWNKMVAVMLTAPFQLSQLSIGTMKSKGWGRIINISSAHGLVASPNKTAYVTIKHGMIGLTKTISLEAAGTGVTCNAVCPGYVETPLFIKQAEDRAKDQGISVEDGKKQILIVHPSGEAVKVTEVAEIVAFLCSSSANQITGASLLVDGGWTAR
jgi:3-hydroxybutyrate dehydrogenase